MSVSRLLKKRDEGTLMPTEAISFEKVLRTGSVYTVLSQDGRHVLVATPRSGPVNNPVIRGEVYLLNNETLVARELKPCGGLHADARLNTRTSVSRVATFSSRARGSSIPMTSRESASANQFSSTRRNHPAIWSPGISRSTT